MLAQVVPFASFRKLHIFREIELWEQLAVLSAHGVDDEFVGKWVGLYIGM